MATTEPRTGDTGESLFIGREEESAWLTLALANRHGLVTGATGTGKTVSLQVMAEGFARAGVPVFAADIKGDLSGIAEVGGRVWIREAFLMGRTSVQQACGEHVGYWTTLGAPILYRADGHKPHRVSDEYGAPFYCVRPSIHMPKRFSRTWGRIASVRPCDLSTIDDAEARREGFDTAAECMAAIRGIYPTQRWFWRVEWERIDRPLLTEAPDGR